MPTAQMKRASIPFPPRLLRRIDRAAKESDESRSAWVRRACAEALEQHETLSKAMANPAIRKAVGSAFADPSVVRAMAANLSDEMSDEQIRLFAKQMAQAASDDA